MKCPLFLSDFTETWIFSADFRKIFKYQISWTFVQWELGSSMWTDGLTDMTKLIVAFHSFANAPKTRMLNLWHPTLFMNKSPAFREVTFVTLYSFYDQSFRENNRNFICHWSMETKSLTMKTLRWPLLFGSIISSKRIINRASVSNLLWTTIFRWSRARTVIKNEITKDHKQA